MLVKKDLSGHGSPMLDKFGHPPRRFGDQRRERLMEGGREAIVNDKERGRNEAAEPQLARLSSTSAAAAAASGRRAWW